MVSSDLALEDGDFLGARGWRPWKGFEGVGTLGNSPT